MASAPKLRSAAQAKSLFRLQVLQLEERCLPSTFTVFNANNAGFGSLRQAVTLANLKPGADVIRFAPSAFGEITLTKSLKIIDDLAIRGPGAERLTISGNGATRLFF